MRPAHAGFISYSDRDAFNAAASFLGAIRTESYEDELIDLQSGPRSITLSDFIVTYAIGASEFGIMDVANLPSFLQNAGIHATSGANFLYASFQIPGIAITSTFQFSTPLFAFGTDIVDVESTSVTFAYNTSSGGTGIAATAGADGNTQFFGVLTLDEPFTTITFSDITRSTGDGMDFDRTSFVPVPIPEGSSSLLLLWLAGVPILCLRRRI